MTAGQTETFESATELQRGHEALLELLEKRTAGGDATDARIEREAVRAIEGDIRRFVERGAATGAVLDDIRERTRAQSLLDYWLGLLRRAELDAPRHRLASFDANRLPELPDEQCPYIGLEAFRTSKYFFGREEDTRRLVARLGEVPLTVVRGASGSGKSSLVFGGVLPALRAESPPRWRIAAPFTPGSEALAGLVRAVEGTMDPPPAEPLLARVATAPATLGSLATRPGEPGILLTIDQFEELFTIAGEGDREVFDAALTSLLDARPEHRVIITVREEFHSRMMRMRGLSRYLQRAETDFSLRPLGFQELKSAIEGPAALVNLKFEDGLVDEQVHAVLGQPAALPLLQFTLRQLWAHRRRNRITREALAAVGGPLQALPRAADEFLGGLLPETQVEVRRVLLALIRVDELLEAYRQPVRRRELLAAGRANTAGVLQLLADHDFVRIGASPDPADAVVEIKHEALLRNWPQLMGWIDEKRKQRRSQLALIETARQWDQAGRPTEGLYRGAQLEEASTWTDLSPLEVAFLETSRAELERAQKEREAHLLREAEEARIWAQRLARRTRVAVYALCAVVVAAVLAGYYSWYATNIERNTADAQQRMASRQTRNERLSSEIARARDKEMSDLQLKLQGEHVARVEQEARKYRDRELIARAQLLPQDTGSLGLLLLQELTSKDDPKILQVAPGVPAPRAVLRHDAAIRSAEFSPDGRTILTASADGVAYLWNSDGRGDPTVLRAGVRLARFAPDGRVVVVSKLGTVHVWEPGGWEPDTAPEPRRLPGDDIGAVASIEFDRDGRRFVTASDDGVARIWDLAGGEAVRSLKGHGLAVTYAEFSPDGKKVVTASRDGTARIWDVATSKERGRFTRHEGAVTVARFSPTGDGRVVSASDDGKAWVWSEKPRGAVELPSHWLAIDDARFSSDGTMVVTASADGKACVSTIEYRGKLVDPGDTCSAEWEHKGAITAVKTVRSGHTAVSASSDKTARVWDLRESSSRMVLGGHTKTVTHVDISRDDAAVLTASADGTVMVWSIFGDGNPLVLHRAPFVRMRAASASSGKQGVATVFTEFSGEFRTVVRIWDWNTLREPVVLSREETIASLVLSPDGRTLATRSFGRSLDLVGTDWPHPSRGRRKHDVAQVSFAPDGQRLVTAGVDHVVRVWALEGGPAVEARGHGDAVQSAAFSGDGRWVVTASADGTARVWDSVTGEERHRFSHEGRVLDAQFSPDGTRVVTAADDAIVRIWPMASQGAPRALSGHGKGEVVVRQSPDGRWIATGSADGVARVWSADGHGTPRVLHEHEGPVLGLAFSRDSAQIVTTSTDLTAKISSVDRPGTLSVLVHDEVVSFAEFSPDGRRVFTASRNGTIRLWLWRGEDHLRHYRSLMTHCLTPHQREEHLGESATQALAGWKTCEKSFGRSGVLRAVGTDRRGVEPGAQPPSFSEWGVPETGVVDQGENFGEDEAVQGGGGAR